MLEFALTVNDGLIDSAADAVTITVTAPANSAPTAAAGADQRVASGAAVTLDGSASDPGNAGQSLTYAWTQTSGPNVVLSDARVAQPGFTAPTLLPGDADRVLEFALTVNDGLIDSAADAVTITVTAPAVPEPAAVASATITAQPAHIVADGTSTSTITVQLRDANNNDLTASGDRVRLATDLGALGAVRDNNDGTYTATLTSATTAGTATVSGTLDGAALTDTAQVVFTPGPVSVAQSTVTAQPGRIVADGAATSTITVQLRDANNNDLTASGGRVRLATDLGALGAVRDNNDGTYTATLTSATTAGTATVSGTLDGTALTDTAQVVFTPAPGVTLSAQAVSVAEKRGTATYTAVLDSQPTGVVIITPSSSDTEAATVTAVLIFTTANWDQPQTVTVTGVDDSLDNPGDARIATISHAVAGGGYGAVPAATVRVTVTDDDAAGIRSSGTDVTLSDGVRFSQPTALVYEVRLRSRPTGDVTVTPTSSDTTVATVSGPLIFTTDNWYVLRAVTVRPVDDDIDHDPNRTTIISHAVSGSGYNDVQAAPFTVTVTDDESAGITLSEGAVSVAENGGTATYTVVLDSQPTGEVIITPSSSDTGAATVAPILTFTAQNWNVAQEITVTGVNDDIDNPGDTRSATLSHRVAGGGYDGVVPGTVAVTVNDDDDSITAPANSAPTAAAGADQRVASGAAVSLDGSASDPGNAGQSLTYAWTQTSGPNVVLSDARVAQPGFTAPTLLPGDADRVLEFALTVNDGLIDSAADTVTITVTAPANSAPTAAAGADQRVASGAAVTLDGSASDPGNAGQSLTYAWTQTSGPNVVLSDARVAQPGFTAPVLLPGDADRVLEFALTVNDGLIDSAADAVTITVTAPANSAPTAAAGADQRVTSGAAVTLDGSASDQCRAKPTYAWIWPQCGAVGCGDHHGDGPGQ